ncbi:MAG: exodeoxyribonuclease VII small subunit [Verrucomicrobia bacterium GWF2_51_19]|nr:MAG: exodeoxyribonuclease VII small subunit [Verrucomicrobia bacterium GWF2_51_19]HCJ11930.1 exodeoxyribonuclease VII small subunit [Opitutae bacterium]
MNVTFEEALSSLEKVVETLETGDIPLAELVKKYEEGLMFLKICENQLKDAELKIQQISQDNTQTTFNGLE